MLSQHFLFFFAMLGTFNGIVLASVLWWQAKGKPTQRWLALLVLVVSVRTGKSAAFHFWPDIPLVVLQLGLTASFFFTAGKISMVDHGLLRLFGLRFLHRLVVALDQGAFFANFDLDRAGFA